MMKLFTAFASLAFFTHALWAQGAQSPRHAVGASGTATVSAKPDQAKLDIGVVTQAATAQDAAAQNATQVDAVLAQLRAILGAAADNQNHQLFS
jgi:uncharacterized protein